MPSFQCILRTVTHEFFFEGQHQTNDNIKRRANASHTENRMGLVTAGGSQPVNRCLELNLIGDRMSSFTSRAKAAEEIPSTSTTSSRAVLSALRALQDKIKRLAEASSSAADAIDAAARTSRSATRARRSRASRRCRQTPSPKHLS